MENQTESFFTPEGAQKETDNEYRYTLQSDFLNALIEGGEIDNHWITGYTAAHYRVELTRYLLTSLVKDLFNVHRRLGYEESFYMMSDRSDLSIHRSYEDTLSFAKNLSDSTYNEAITDLEAAYDHTQNMLDKFNYVDQAGYVTIYRSLSEMELAQILDKSQNLNQLNVYQITTNVILSAQRPNIYYGLSYKHKAITVKLRIPKSNIIFHPDFIITSHYDGAFEKRNSLEYENEVIFINPNNKGIMTFGSEDMEINEHTLNQFKTYVKDNKSAHQQIAFHQRNNDGIDQTDTFVVEIMTAKFIYLRHRFRAIYSRLPLHIKLLTRKYLDIDK